MMPRSGIMEVNLDRKFSIGEVSKLHNVSVQTLRHYDKIGLLKPAYINEKSNYRFYSIDNFIMLEFIKQCKVMGLTLEEIKKLKNNYTSINSILDIITKQKELLTYKIKELENIKLNIDILEKKVQTALDEGIGQPFIKYCSKRSYIKHSNIKRYTEEFEIELTEKLREIENKYGEVYKELSFAISYDKYKLSNHLDYDHMLLCFYDDIMNDEEKSGVLSEGEYLTINFEDDYKDTKYYYDKLIKYIEDEKINVGDTFYESYILTYIGKGEEVKSLGQIQIEMLDNLR